MQPDPTFSKINKLFKTASQPRWAVRRLLNKLKGQSQTEGHSRQKDKLFLQYGRLAQMQGFDQLYVLLSFDCDTPEDIAAAEHLDGWLRQRGIKATYAVPGTQLAQGANVYRRLAEKGADFINHGARPHTEWREDRYWSVTFYHEMSPQEVIEDIERGHEIFYRVLERTPVGFRAPHFGNFQATEQRELIYDTLRKLGYRYSSSTLPKFGLEHGPLLDVGGLYEIPLSGSYATPFNILDSWNYVQSPEQPSVRNEYTALFIQTVERLLTLRVPGVLNYYVDPAHVYQADAFYQAMTYLIECQVQTIDYGWLLETVRKCAVS
jgi:hypothetical protein